MMMGEKIFRVSAVSSMLKKADPIYTMSPFQHEIKPMCRSAWQNAPHPLSVAAKIGPRAAEGLVPGTDLLLARGRLPPLPPTEGVEVDRGTSDKPESANALLEGQGPGLSFMIDVILSHSGKQTCVRVVYMRQIKAWTLTSTQERPGPA
jgi:hypothetical protein